MNMLNMRHKVREQGEEKYKEQSKERLEKIITTKIRTTMIGALASIEEHLGFLWQPKDGKMSSEAIEFQSLYEKVRQEILDNGNNQIRNIKSEMENYSVEWLRYRLTLPFRQPGTQTEGKNDKEQDKS